MNLKSMDQLIDSWRDEIIEKMRTWIAIPSLKAEASQKNAPFGTDVRHMLDLFLKDAGEMGFTVDDVDGYAGSAQMGQGEKMMGILAHLDIVPAGDGWSFDPFAGTVRDGFIYGRGVLDDKGPALGALYAMRAVKEAGIPLKDTVRLIVGCDEETGMNDMAYYRTARKLPDYGFSPDASYPLINIEKGGLNLKLSKVTGGEVDAEIPVYSLYAGVRPNVVPGSAVAEIGTARVPLGDIQQRLAEIGERHGFSLKASPIAGENRARIEAEGRQAHASTPELGLNAAGVLLIALSELGAGGGSRQAIDALAQRIGIEYTGRNLGIEIRDELSGPLTCNLGILRYDGFELTAQLDIRYPISADEATMCGQAVMALSSDGIALTRVGGHVPLHVPADSVIVQGLLEVYHEVTGLPAYAMAIGGGTYSQTMPNTVAFGISFPDEEDCCHMPDERLNLDRFMQSIHIMAHAIVRLAGAPVGQA